MMKSRVFPLEADVRFSDESATVTEISQTENASIAIWGVKPGQIKLLKLIVTPMDKIPG